MTNDTNGVEAADLAERKLAEQAYINGGLTQDQIGSADWKAFWAGWQERAALAQQPAEVEQWIGTDELGPVLELKFRDGRTAKTRDPASWRWSDRSEDGDIVGWRPESAYAARPRPDPAANALVGERWVETRTVKFHHTVQMSLGYDWEPWELCRLEMHTPHGSFAIWPDRIGGKRWSIYCTANGIMKLDAYTQETAKAECEMLAESLAAAPIPASDGQQAPCPVCNGNDAEAPCAYPSEGQPGCLRDIRLGRAAPGPKMREPLTRKQIDDGFDGACRDMDAGDSFFEVGVRYAERMHGIGPTEEPSAQAPTLAQIAAAHTPEWRAAVQEAGAAEPPWFGLPMPMPEPRWRVPFTNTEDCYSSEQMIAFGHACKRSAPPVAAPGEVEREQRDIAIDMLARWCIAVDENGTGWDDWDEHYKDAMYRPGPLRELLDVAIAAAKGKA